MNIITGYTGENHITSADDASLHRAIFGDGDYVLDTGSRFNAYIIDNNTIRIYDGDLLIQGHLARINPGEYEEVTIDNGTPDTKRYDLIVAKYLKDSVTGIESVTLEVIKGQAGSYPIEPNITQDDLINGGLERDFVLYRVLIDGATLDSVEKRYETVKVARVENDDFEVIGGGDNTISTYSGRNRISSQSGENIITTVWGTNTIRGKTYIMSGDHTITFPDDFAKGAINDLSLYDIDSKILDDSVLANYSKVWKTVTLQIRVEIVGDVGTKALQIATLPEALRPNATHAISVVVSNSAYVPKFAASGTVNPSGIIYPMKPTGYNLTGADLATGDIIYITGTYMIA